MTGSSGPSILLHSICDGADILKTGLKAIISKKVRRAISLGAVENLDQGQKSEGTRCNQSNRWDVLGLSPLTNCKWFQTRSEGA